MRYFLTGGTGFIGSRVARRLVERGDEVVALARNPDAPAARSLADVGVELARGDITVPGTLRQPVRGVDGVFHLAAWYRVGDDADRAAAINVDGTRNVLEAMREFDVPKGVYTSTLAVNSDTDGRRLHESYRHDGPHLSAYDETKWRAHHEVARPMIERGLPLVIVMPGAVYGPGDTSQLGDLLRRAARG
ncbi:MAG: NAD-dependent epimerase/dehydratase family protein, partial [Gemmatimonadota bacterium]